MASDLTTSKDEIKEVKELLLRLINPGPVQAANQAPVTWTPTNAMSHQDASITTAQCTPVSQDVREHPVTSPTQGTGIAVTVSYPVDPQVPTSAPSWASGETVPVTPNTLLQNFCNNMPIGAAVSTDISVDTGTTSHGLSPQSGRVDSERINMLAGPTGCFASNDPAPVIDNSLPKVTTRRMVSTTEKEAAPRGPRPRFELTLQPRITSGPIAANALCYILHPDHGNTIVAEGRTGGSWKSPSQKYGSLCSEGEQMVQIHKILKQNLPLPIIEDRVPFTTMDQALVKPSGSSVYVKWKSRLL